MDIKEYQTMYAVEDEHWWYAGLRKLVLACIEKYSFDSSSPALLDAGCGTGGMLAACTAYNAFGLDISDEALKFCRMRNLRNLRQGSVCSLPFSENSFDIIISLDVLYHLDVADDFEALKEFYRVMARKGILLLNLPAYNFLKSSHDEKIHTRQRYTLRKVRDNVERAGFVIERITYRNALLFPVAAIVRLIKKILPANPTEKGSDLKPLPAPINALLTGIILLENRLISHGVNFPFGLSVFCIARKR